MIYVNDKQANLKDGKSVVGKEYQKALDYFDEIGWPIRFRVKKELLSRDETVDGDVFMRMPPYFIHHTALLHTEYGTERWRYTPLAPYDRNGTLQWPTEGRGDLYDKKVITFNKDRADLAFFLWFKSKPFQSIYNIDDVKQKAEARVRAEMDAIKLKNAFYSEYSVLQKDKKKLRTIARAYNVPNVSILDDNMILINLESVIKDLVQQKVTTVDDFIESLNLDPLTELAAKIQKAYDDKLIVFEDTSCTWSYVGEGGRIGEKIINVPINNKDNNFAHLRDYFSTHDKAYKIFEEHVGTHGANENLDLDPYNLENESWNKILAFIKNVGIPTVGKNRKKEDVFNDIREMLIKK